MAWTFQLAHRRETAGIRSKGNLKRGGKKSNFQPSIKFGYDTFFFFKIANLQELKRALLSASMIRVFFPRKLCRIIQLQVENFSFLLHDFGPARWIELACIVARVGRLRDTRRDTSKGSRVRLNTPCAHD